MVVDGAWAPQGDVALIADYLTGRLLLWNQAARTEEATWKDWDYPTSVAISPSLNSLATGYSSAGLAEQPIIIIWDRHSQEKTLTITGFATVTGLSFSPDGLRFAAADGGVSLYNASTGAPAGTLEFDPAFRPAVAVAFSPDGALLAAGHYDGSITTWDAKSLTQIGDQQALTAEAFQDRPLYSIAFSPDGKLLAAGSPESTEVAVLNTLGPPVDAPVEVGHPVYSLAFSPDGQALSVGGDSEITLWSFPGPTLRCKLITDATSIVGLAFSPDGNSVLSTSMEGTFSEWQLEDACSPAE